MQIRCFCRRVHKHAAQFAAEINAENLNNNLKSFT